MSESKQNVLARFTEISPKSVKIWLIFFGKKIPSSKSYFRHMACVYLIFLPSANNDNVHRTSLLFMP